MDKPGDILAQSPRLKLAVKKAAPLTAPKLKLIEAASAIRVNPDDIEVAFMARELVQCTLPHKDPGKKKPIWKRVNGEFILSIQQGYDRETGEPLGFPYGCLPRLLLFWINTEAVRTKKRRLELGHHLSTFMRELGLIPTSAGAGKRSDARRLQDQMRRLFRAIISFDTKVKRSPHTGEGWLDMQVAPEGFLWWDERRPEQGSLWGSWIELGERFFEAIIAFPVPIDMRVLKAIKRSPLALDLYAWSTWRVFKLDKSAFIPWDGLKQQLGAEYKNTDEFARKAKAAFRKIQAVYPALKLNYTKGGLVLHPSRTAVAPAPKRVEPVGT